MPWSICSLILPPVVTGYMLLLLLGRRGPLGELLENWFGIVVAFRWTGAVIAATVMAFPVMVRPIRLSIEAIDRRLEAAAGTLGASPLAVFADGHPAAGAARHRRRRHPGLRQGHGRVRRDDHLRLQHPGRDPDPRARDLHPDPGSGRRAPARPPDADRHRGLARSTARGSSSSAARWHGGSPHERPRGRRRRPCRRASRSTSALRARAASPRCSAIRAPARPRWST